MSKHRIIGYIFTIFLVVGSCVYLPDLAQAAGKVQIKFATVAPDGSTWVNKMRDLDKKLAQKTGDEIRIRIYAGGIAGDEADVLKKIRIGQIHCAAFSGVGITQILPMVRIFDLPFLFRNRKEIDTVQEELSDYFSEEFRKVGFEFLSWVEVGDVYLFSKKPIEKKSDLSGLKIWTWSGDPVSKETFSILGTNPIPVSITDVTTALNTNMIDTVYAPPLGALALQWNNYVDYMTPFPITHSTGVVLISSKYFNKIPDNLATIFKDEIEKSLAELTSELISQTSEAIDIIKTGGVRISPMPAESEMEEFYNIRDQVANRLAGKVYPAELLSKVNQILDRVRKIP